MKKAKKDGLKFLEQQLQWCKEQDHILEKIETTLYGMKKIAKYGVDNKFNPLETKKLKDEMVY